MFYPTYSMIKAENLSDKYRGTISTLFKIPVNIAIVLMLINMPSLGNFNKVFMNV